MAGIYRGLSREIHSRTDAASLEYWWVKLENKVVLMYAAIIIIV
jgi:hypothetical protein